MIDLSNLPKSIQDSIKQAQASGDNRAAETMLRQAITDLARSNPELCGLVVGSQMGYQNLSSREVEETSHWERIPVRILGIEIGSRLQELTTTRVKERRWRLF